MKQQAFGATVAALRKERGMTQLELAEQMGVTDKAVSKWERDLSLPDTASLPKLAETLGVTVDELMLGKPAGPAADASPAPSEAARLVPLILQGVALAMGVAVTALSRGRNSPFRPASARRRSRPAHAGAGPCVPGGRAAHRPGTVKQTLKAKGPASCDAEPFCMTRTGIPAG